MAESGNQVIRVFLSSTFVDFQEERSLLVKQVFPSLRRRARSRGVEIVDVDLRWGVTEEQTKRGETLPLCLAEIDRCRPYFISLLGERYGWVPPADYYKPELLERQPWLREQMGGASVTELEILHGVLRNPEMAGHACFYLRDPAYAQAQSQPGWVAENPQERQRLVALKEEVRRSGFPVMEGLADPQAIAERIEADLWELIERTFPEQEPPDALEREGRRHADYRRARTGLYLGGETAIAQLEGWLAAGEQRILITGESGAGKSALIANWLEAHQRSYPQDLVHAHHLGCTNDASAVRPLLGRLIDTASQLLLAEQQIAEPLKVPQDWWELVFKVGEVFALLSPWCERNGRCWILVLDGLDRLAEDDQQALPWIPTTIPPGIHVVASALDCSVRSILLEREYLTQEIGPLGKAQQQQLIERYLSRYTKQLESGLQQRILAHQLAGSPLFLKVLLEELRQCAWFDTLAEQLEFYLSAETIDGLYGKVLERLERDGHGEATRKSLTALWASRAGLSETELLAITGLAPLDWVPVDLALSEGFGRNGDRLVFGHEFVRKAVLDRYLPSEKHYKQVHSDLAEWFQAPREGWDGRHSEEFLWQLQQAGRTEELRDLLLTPMTLVYVVQDRGSREVLNYWQMTISNGEEELDEILWAPIQQELDRLRDQTNETVFFADKISEFLEDAGLYRDLHLELRRLSHQKDGPLEEEVWPGSQRFHKLKYALALHMNGQRDKAIELLRECILDELNEDHRDYRLYLRMCDLASMLAEAGNDESTSEAIDYYEKALPGLELAFGGEHPDCISLRQDYAILLSDAGRHQEARSILNQCLEDNQYLFGDDSIESALTKWNLAVFLFDHGQPNESNKSLSLARQSIASYETLLMGDHTNTLIKKIDLGLMLVKTGQKKQGLKIARESLKKIVTILGRKHPIAIHAFEIMTEIEFRSGHPVRSLVLLPKAFGI